MVLAREDDKGWDGLPLRVDALDDAGPLPVALVHCLGLPQCLEPVTTAPVNITPIIKPDLSRL